MIDPTVLEGLSRGVAIGGLAAMAGALATAGGGKAPVRWIGLAFCAAAVGHILDNWDALRGSAIHASLPTWVLSALGPGLFWAFTVSLFDDRPADWRLAVPPAASLSLSLFTVALPGDAQVIKTAYDLLSAALVVHALAVVWQGWRGDLVERRRQLRGAVVIGAGLYVLALAAGNLDLGMHIPAEPLPQALVLAILSIAGAVTLLRADPHVLAAAPREVAKPPILASPDRTALERLHAAMEKEEVWRDENLSIAGLADKLGLAEHRLRRLINRELGYRNFSAFLNASRIEAAKAELCNPALARKTIAAVAFDLGFSSLGPFNRAFKEATGMTPSAWRRGEHEPPNSENPLRI